jgi:heterogeneous nuclear rnp K-like protein 2
MSSLGRYIVIGKAGIKINEIRTQSQCHIRVTDPGTPATPGGQVNPGERLIIISGHPNNLNMAVNMLHGVRASWSVLI